MPLVKCREPDCGTMLSTQATACPRCGCSVVTTQMSENPPILSDPSTKNATDYPSTTLGRRLFTDRQIFAGAFLGGPAALAILLSLNFYRIGRKDWMRNCIIFFCIAVPAFLVFSMCLPDSVGGSVGTGFAVVIAYCGQQIAKKYFPTRESLMQSNPQQTISTWYVSLVAIIGIVITLVCAFAIAAIGIALGVIAT